MNNLKTVAENTEFTLTEKKSKFIANLIYVESQAEAEELIKQFKKKYHDARHNCTAFRVFENEQIIEKSSDDGEPSGTAGAPMLNILQKNNLCNVLIIVTRYFGGILLGTGGLVRAYSDSLSGAIESAEILDIALGLEAEVIVDYNNFEKFQYYCRTNEISIINTQYLENIVCKISMEEAKKNKFVKDYEEKNINLNSLEIFGKKTIIKSKIKY